MIEFLRRNCWRILWGAVREWHEDKVPRLAAALAFYTIFALTPVVLVADAIARISPNRDKLLKDFTNQVEILAGPKGGDLAEQLLQHVNEQSGNRIAALLGLSVMFYAASAAFVELKDALDTIWQVQPKSGLRIWPMIRRHFLSFAMMLIIGFFLLVSLVLSTAISMVGETLSIVISQAVAVAVISFLIASLLFALIYKLLPDVDVAWRDVWFGAAIAAVLFATGKSLFGLYLGQSTISVTYGPAASLVIVVLWTYYSALILLFGAEVTQVQSELRGARPKPHDDAIPLTDHDRIQQGIPRDDQVEEGLREQERQKTTAETTADAAAPADISPVGTSERDA